MVISIAICIKINRPQYFRRKAFSSNQLMPLLANITNTVERNEYIIRISNVLGIDEGVIRSDLQRQNSQRKFNAYDVSTDNLPGINSRKAFSEKKML